MVFGLSNPHRFMAVSRFVWPVLAAVAAGLIAWGLYLTFTVPEDYQQGATVRLMFIHVPAAYIAMASYAALGGASFFALVFRHALADAAARACAPLGAVFTALALITGSLWGKPMWGTFWVWDARLTSVLVLFLLFVGYIALRASIDDEAKAGRAGAILALVGSINLPIIHFSVEWWNSQHQGATLVRAGGPAMPMTYVVPLLLMIFGYTFAFAALWLVRTRAEVWRRRAQARAWREANA